LAINNQYDLLPVFLSFNFEIAFDRSQVLQWFSHLT